MKFQITTLILLLVFSMSFGQDKANKPVKVQQPSAVEVKPIKVQPPVARPVKVDKVVAPKNKTRKTVEQMDLRTVVDFEGNEYRINKYGDQWWMVVDLRSKYNANGWELNREWTTWAGTYPYYEPYNNGYMYHWKILLQNNPADQIGVSPGYNGSSTVPSGVRGICPEGSHIPSEGEWLELINWAGGVEQAATQLKSILNLEYGNYYWSCTNNGGTVKIIKVVEGRDNVYIMDGSNNSLHHLRCVMD